MNNKKKKLLRDEEYITPAMRSALSCGQVTPLDLGAYGPEGTMCWYVPSWQDAPVMRSSVPAARSRFISTTEFDPGQLEQGTPAGPRPKFIDDAELALKKEKE